MDSEGRRLHGLAAEACERGEHLESLKLSDEALLAFGEEGNDLGNFPEAIKHYGEAVDNYKDDRPAYLATIKVHLTTCQYKNGDKSTLNRAIQALTEIEASDEEKYNKDVWRS